MKKGMHAARAADFSPGAGEFDYSCIVIHIKNFSTRCLMHGIVLLTGEKLTVIHGGAQKEHTVGETGTKEEDEFADAIEDSSDNSKTEDIAIISRPEAPLLLEPTKELSVGFPTAPPATESENPMESTESENPVRAETYGSTAKYGCFVPVAVNSFDEVPPYIHCDKERRASFGDSVKWVRRALSKFSFGDESNVISPSRYQPLPQAPFCECCCGLTCFGSHSRGILIMV
jgi:hypothetical protein